MTLHGDGNGGEFVAAGTGLGTVTSNRGITRLDLLCSALLRVVAGGGSRAPTHTHGKMSSTAGPVAFVGADELSVELAASFLRSGARVRSFVPEVSRLCSPRSPTFRSSSSVLP